MTTKKYQNLTLYLFLTFLFVCFLQSGLIAQEYSNEFAQAGNELSQTEEARNGFLATFLRTPFALFCFAGVISGIVFSAIIEFFYNIFCGFNCGYTNTWIIWDLGWNTIVSDWYWKPSVWWHVVISVLFWGPILKRKKSKRTSE
ncbi:MAG: hypothetical protein P1U56_12780 [Saprospiraceae bacterium]|nr:hypothetical protein [Saprospiraceae bacterium]